MYIIAQKIKTRLYWFIMTIIMKGTMTIYPAYYVYRLYGTDMIIRSLHDILLSRSTRRKHEKRYWNAPSVTISHVPFYCIFNPHFLNFPLHRLSFCSFCLFSLIYYKYPIFMKMFECNKNWLTVTRVKVLHFI